MTIYRLNQNERSIIACLELDATASIQTVAKRLSKRTHTVQYLLNKLEANHVIRKSPFIDIYKLGFRYCGVFFSATSDQKQTQSMIAYLAASESVGWFSELGGEYAYGVAVVVQSPNEANEFLLNLIKKTGIKIYKKAISFRLFLLDTPRQYLTTQSISRTPLSMKDGVQLVQLDPLDRKILSTLSSAPDLSYRAMAKEIGVAHTTFDLRLRNLKKQGVVLGTTLEIDLMYLNREVVKILLFSRSKDPILSRDLRQFAIDHPFVSHFVEAFGEWDYELNLEVEFSSQVRDVLDQIQLKFGEHIIDCQPLSILKTHRVSRYPFTL